MDKDPFQINIDGVDDLVSSKTNKVYTGNSDEEGVVGDYQDELSLDLSDEELLDLKKQYESDYAGYSPKVVARQKKNKEYLLGMQFGNTRRMVPVTPRIPSAGGATRLRRSTSSGWTS